MHRSAIGGEFRGSFGQGQGGALGGATGLGLVALAVAGSWSLNSTGARRCCMCQVT